MKVKELMEIMKDANPEAKVFLHINVKDQAYEAYEAKHFTSSEGMPYDGTGQIYDEADEKSCCFVIADWEI